MSHSISFSIKNNKLFAEITLVGGEAKVSPPDLNKALRQSDFAALDLDDELVENLVTSCEMELAMLEEGDQSLPLPFSVGNTADATVKVTIPKDQMTADVEIIKEIGGKPTNFEKIKQACLDAGVRFGLKNSLMESLLSAYAKAGMGEEIIGTVAKGTAAEDGQNTYFKPLVNLFAEKVRKPRENDDGSVDLRDLGQIETVEQGTPILEKIPFTLGKNGRNVLGDKLPAMPGKDNDIVVSPTTELDQENPNILLAKQTGMVRFNGQVMEVDDVVVYKELTPREGHIKFKGSVIIKGDVSPDMKIFATGDIVVGGFVESASIKCGGELNLMSGASGRLLDEKEQNELGFKYNCQLVAGGSINMAFANQCEVTAKNNVNVKKQISHCNVEADAMTVGVGDKPRGQITGGRYYLCKMLKAGIIGTESNVHCDVSMNRTYDIFMVKEAELVTWIDTLQERYDKEEAEFNRVMDPEIKRQAEQKMNLIGAKIAKYNGHKSALMAKRREYMERVNVELHQRLHPKVTFYVADRVVLIDETKGPSRAHIVDYELIIEPLI